MADNIKIIGDINETERISRFDSEDIRLLNFSDITQYFGYKNDYIEFFVYDDSEVILELNYNYKNFKLPNNSYVAPGTTLPAVEIDPVKDLQNLGYSSGTYKVQYNFFKKKISDFNRELFISEISDDRTELKINSTLISSAELVAHGQQLINELNNSPYQKYYLLNFSSNAQQVAVNIAVDNTGDIPSLLFKLYHPLPDDIFVKDSLSVVEEIIEPFVFTINLDTIVEPAPLPQLRGPNFDIDIDSKQNLSSEYETYNSLVSSLTGSSYQRVLNYMNDKSYDLNIDYTSFDNFIHFSSAKKRLEIFKDKLELVESYNNNINSLLASTYTLKNLETASIKQKIDNIISNFDGFEHYLYFESSSYTWPKLTNSKPYTLAHSTSSIGLTWFNNYTSSATNYDENNLDHLYNALPNYVKNDADGYKSYFNFIDMIGHYFDNIWIYITSINELYNADNNLEKGISKDIVYDALRSLGVKLYNNKGNNQFSDYITGLNSGSTLFNNDFSATSSFLNNVPKKDLLSELYKRIYHNTILLNKNKGTYEGLQNLITTFGVTSSIFSPKEFGGTAKNNQLKGYNTDKITIHNNSITGSVLSPFISLQQPYTSSGNFKSTDLHFVDLSFSPQTQLDSRVSSSIALLNPTFSLDQYIGDPRLMESASYDDLITQQNYFISASAAVSGSAQRLDYKGFAELVKYFDNSLFKMLKDFVPARTNTLTGITIKSPVLERNKIKLYRPKVTQELNYNADYDGPVISEDRDYHYDFIEGNKSKFYTGEFSGSYANINDIFEKSNPNIYLHPTSSVNLNEFNHTDFNVTLNNVSSSVTSVSRQKIEKRYSISNQQVLVNNGEYSSSAELQESNLSLKGFQNSRYDGTKLSSLTYNTYSSASSTYSGDISYGKTAVIDYNTRKLGLFTQIKESTIFEFPKRNNVAIKYLVDENGNLTELNKKNKNWHEIQNTFKIGENLTVAQFDNQKASDQRATDGIKTIYNSGYSYFPIMYTGTDSRLHFNYTGDTNSKNFRIELAGGFISGSSSDLYPIKSGNIPLAFNKTVDIANPLFGDGNVYYADNGTNTFSTYSIQETSEQQFNAKFIVKVEFQSVNQSGNLTFNINKVGTATPLATQTVSVASGFTSTRRTDYGFAKKLGNTITLTSAVKVYDAGNNYIETLPINTVLYAIQAGPGVASGCFLFTSTILYVDSQYYSSIGTLSSGCTDIYTLPSFGRKLYTAPVNSLVNYMYFDLSTAYQPFTINDKISFEFKIGSGGFSTNNFTASLEKYDGTSNGVIYNQLVKNQVGSNPYASNTLVPFISGSTNIGTTRNNTLILSEELSYFLDYQYLPSGSGFQQNSQYNKYGDVNYTFSPKIGDIILIYYGSGNYLEGNIASIFKSKLDNKVYITLSSELPSSLTLPAYVSNTVSRFIILDRKPDENNLILSFEKKPGDTSLGIIIPNDIHPDILANIDTITKEVKQKLIDVGTTNIGTF